MRDGDADRASPYAPIVGDEAGEKVLILPRRRAVLEGQAHDLVARSLGAVPRAMQRNEGVALISLRELRALIERDPQWRRMGLDQDIRDSDLVGEIGALSLVMR